jgi:hypothetical protein
MGLVFEVNGAPPPQGDGWGQPTAGTTNEYRIGIWRVKGAEVTKGPNGPALQVNLLKRVLFIQTDDLPAWASAVGQAQANAGPIPPEVLARREANKAAKTGAPPPPRRCSYCNALSPAGSTKCASCGAPF